MPAGSDADARSDRHAVSDTDGFATRDVARLLQTIAVDSPIQVGDDIQVTALDLADRATVCSFDEFERTTPRRRGTPQRVDQPGSLLARLAVDSTHQGEGLGRDLFVDAGRLAVEASERVGGRFIAVDPLDERARSIYTGWGFEPVVGDEGGRPVLLPTKAIASFVLAEDEGSA